MVELKTENKYICSECRHEYLSKQDALNCETRDKREKRIDNIDIFEMTENHIKLLNNFYVNWDDCEFGAPCINPKRPYGNSSGVDDVAEVLGIKKTKDNVEGYDKDEVKEYQAQDPIEKVLATIKKNNWASDSDIVSIEKKVEDIVLESVKFAEESPFPTIDELLQDVYVQEDYPYIKE